MNENSSEKMKVPNTAKIALIIKNISLIFGVLLFLVIFIGESLKILFKITFNIDYGIVSSFLLGTIAVDLLLEGIDTAKSKEDTNTKFKILSDNLINHFNKSFNKLVNNLKAIEIIKFKDINEVDEYIAEKINAAKYSVYDLNWQDDLINVTPLKHQARINSANKIDLAIKSYCNKKNDIVCYQEIFTFSNHDNIERMNKHINYGDTYSCYYYENLDVIKRFPKLQFVVIDENEVIFASSAYEGKLCAIKNDEIVGIFCLYFSRAIDFSIKIKERGNLNSKIIDDIIKKYGAADEKMA